MRYLKPLSPAIFFGIIFIITIFAIPYPDSLAQANLSQIVPFFASLFLILIFILNIFLKNIFLSLSISLGLVFLLVLNALDSLNILTGTLTIVATSLLISYFWKAKSRSLTNGSKIPKLTKLRRQK